MKNINWNQASELELIVHINCKTLHQLGLAISHNTESGTSEMLLVSPYGVWELAHTLMASAPKISKEATRTKIAEWTKEQQV